jgi:hypothetical protein
MSAVTLFTPAPPSPPVDTIVILSTCQRFGERANDVRQTGEQLVENGGFIVTRDRRSL